jgi:cold shock CspA family protein
MESKKGVAKLKKWFPDRGFGFIEETSEQGIRREYFVHASAVRLDSAPPIVGAEAAFTAVLGPKGLAAINVKFSPKPEITESLIATLTTAAQSLSTSEEVPQDGGAL